MIAETNYGGRVTDPNDRVLLKVVLDQCFSPKMLEDNFKFSESGIYSMPEDGGYDRYKTAIVAMP